ncbi:hypothetical protein RF11_06647 [Thelohanellus kitauei]|uniref:Uncharacterized protein n=1 Tax=Thelohanellus kitauei TaxID=669202 RepID=A0A0C2MK42_THEKT|nr:hypothetical protein RF11_06647 [Thelohanellus kitauei]
MLKLFCARNVRGRNLKSSVIDNSISVSNKLFKERAVDILRSIPLAKPPYFHEHDQFLKIYPSCNEDDSKIRQTLKQNGISTLKNSMNEERRGFSIEDRLIMNFVPDGREPFMSVIRPNNYELFNVSKLDQDKLLFLNCYASKHVSRVSFAYKKDRIMKMSPNIIQIRHVYHLTHENIDKLFSGIHFHKISPPLTPRGVWKLYVAKREDYLLLLSRPYLFGSQLLDITPYYESSLRLPLETKISTSQIYLYSRSNKLSTIEQIKEAIPDLLNVNIAKCNYENGNLFIFNIHDRSKFLKVIHLNGSSLNGTTRYLMTFGDYITNKWQQSTKEEIEKIFDGIPFESIRQIRDDAHYVTFSPENFEAARFRLKPSRDYFLSHTSFRQSRIFNKTSLYFINHFFYESKGQVELPFEHRVLDRNGDIFYCITNLENYFNYCYRSIPTSQGPIVLTPYKCSISLQHSYIKVMDEDALQFVSRQISLMNIPLRVDESRRYIHPRFSSFNDLDRFTYFLFSQDIYPEKASFFPGRDILKL